MKIFRNIGQAIWWQTGIMALLVRDRPFSSILCVGFAAVGQVCQVLAFLLPLKVILIAGSDRVPSFLRPIIDESQRGIAIALLAVASVGCFGAARLIDGIVARIARRNATRIVETSNSRSVAAMRQQEAAEHYQNFVEIASGLLFTGVMMALVGFLNPILTSSIMAAAFGIFLIFVAVQSRRPGGTDNVNRDVVSATLQIGSTVLFFVGFLSILLQIWMAGGDGGQLTALISFVVLRRLLSAASTSIKDSFKVAMARPLIDVLFSPHHQFVAPAEKGDMERDGAFDRARRTRRATLALAPVVGKIETLTSSWRDTSGRPYQAFAVTVPPANAEGEPREFIERLFVEKDRHWLDHEQFLFLHVQHETIGAPVPVVTTTDAGFVGDLFELRVLSEPRRAMDEAVTTKLTDLWKVPPTADLLKSYRTSARTLPERMTREFVQSLRIAADTPEEHALYEELLLKREAIVETLEAVPLYIHNPDLSPRSLYQTPDERTVTIDWGRWSIEPIGFVLPNAVDADAFGEILKETARIRGDVETDALTHEAVQFVQTCVRFETAANRREYKRAFVHLEELLTSLPVRGETAVSPENGGEPVPAAGSR